MKGNPFPKFGYKTAAAAPDRTVGVMSAVMYLIRRGKLTPEEGQQAVAQHTAVTRNNFRNAHIMAV